MKLAKFKQGLFESLSKQLDTADEDFQVVRAAVPVDSVPAIAWLAAQSIDGKLYVADQGDTRQLAACGIADRVQYNETVPIATACETVSKRLAAAPAGTRYYGGFRFTDHPRPAACWRQFGSALFLLPRFELLQSPDQGTLLTCNAVVSNGDRDSLLDRLQADLHQLRLDIPPLAADQALPELRQESQSPGEAGWHDMVDAALARIETTELEKLVLARVTRWEFAAALPALELFERLRRQTPGCLHFFLQPGNDAAFLGATPEILFHRRGRQLESAAIAGTRPRGVDAASDKRLARELAESDKEQREHAFVSRAVQAALQPLCNCSELETSAHVLKLQQVQHLCQSFRGELRQDVADSDLLTALHPTPAVGGFPMAPALESLTELEPCDRGWYAAPIGWLGKGSSGFAVAIRSGLVRNNIVQLYAGAGIVQGSNPDAEWDELDSKLEAFRDAVK